jgi:hypothetical protein
MTKDLSKLIWPVTALACSAIIAAGVYFGLRSNQPPAAPRYGTPSAPGYAAPSTAPAAEQAYAERPAPGESGTIVYVTRTGQCYHRAGCSSLSRSKIPMDLNEAKKRYRPCSRCNPPR